MRDRPVDQAQVTLDAYDPATRAALVPILLYKSLFLADWYTALVREEQQDEARRVLQAVQNQTLGELLSVLSVMNEWDALRAAPVPEDLSAILKHRALEDLLQIKEGSNEAVLMLAMRAPTQDIRSKLVHLADLDRVHADHLRDLLGVARLDRIARERPAQAKDGPLGAHARRLPDATLGASVRAVLADAHASERHVRRLVVSPEAARHLRDEGHVTPEGRIFGLPTDVDFGWRGECFAIETDERVGLAELITSGEGLG